LYSDASDIQGVDFRLYSWDGADTGTSVELSGTASVVGTSRNGVVFVPTNALQQSKHYYAAVVSGTAINSSGIRASIAFGGSVDWNFETTSSVSTGFIKQVAFDNYTTNQLYTAAMAESDFLAMPSVSKLTTSVNGLNGAGAAYISDSPDGNPARGKVLKFFWEGTHPDGPELGNHLNLFAHFDSKHRNLSPQTGNIPAGISVNDYPMSNEACGTTSNPGVPPLTTAQAREAEHTAWVGGGGAKYRFDELYTAFDVYFPGDWQPLNYHKFPSMGSGNSLQASHGKYAAANREGYYGLTCAGYLAGYEFGPSSNYLSANPVPVLKTMAFGGYIYSSNGTQENAWCNSVDPTINPTLASEHVYFPKGEWVSIEYRFLLNSTDQDYTSIDYAPDWVGSGNRWYWPTWAPQIDPNISTSVRRDNPTAATDLVDGVFEIWMKREGEATAKKILTRTRRFRHWEYLKITHGHPRFSNNPNTKLRISLPRVDQSYYVDNYRWKETPILPR